MPFDLGSTIVTGVNVQAYRKLVAHLGLGDLPAAVLYERSGIADMDERVLRRLRVDTRGLLPATYSPARWARERSEDQTHRTIVDEWGISWRQPKDGGLYYDVSGSPLAEAASLEELSGYRWPDHSRKDRVEGLDVRARQLREQTDCALVVESELAETFTTPFMLRGYENFYIDLIDKPELACYLMDRMVEIQLAYWRTALETIQAYPLILRTGDDLGDQRRTLISPQMYRAMVKPRHARLFAGIRKLARGKVYLFFHSDGAVRDLIPDLIEIGVDILNPVQYTAEGMDTRRLKKEFGSDIVFWGGGVDTQHILPKGSREEVRDEVKRRIDDLAPGGGFVFTPVHNTQYDVPPENFMVMWETLQRYGSYR